MRRSRRSSENEVHGQNEYRLETREPRRGRWALQATLAGSPSDERCPECNVPLKVVCPNCGEYAPEADQTCPSCGGSLAHAEQPR